MGVKGKNVVRLDIKTLEKYSGLKAHTIRAWEHRFNVLAPARTAGNRRSYNADDLKLLLDFAILNRYGSPISKLLHLTPDEISKKISLLKTTPAKKDACLNELIVSFVKSEIVLFEHILSGYTEENGIQRTIDDLILPFIERTGLYYYINQHSSTHFAVTSIRRKLHGAIESLSLNKNGPAAILFLPEGQHFDLILLYLSYLLQIEGYCVLYLGTNVSHEILRNVAEQYKPEWLVSYLVPAGKSVPEDSKTFRSINCDHKNLIVGMPDTDKKPEGFNSIRFHELLPFVKAKN